MSSSVLPPHATCPSCQQVTPLPSLVAATAVLRCPHCRAQFALQDLLVDPEIVWEVVSETVSPGAETVEISGYEALLENWNGEPADEVYELTDESADEIDEIYELTDASAAPALQENLEEEPQKPSPRQLEGPLVGEFPDDPEFELEYPGEPAWRSANARAAADQTQLEEPATAGEPSGEAAFQSFSNRPAVRGKRPRRSPLWFMLQVGLGGLAAVPVSLLLMWHLLGTDIGDAAPWVAQYVPWIVPQKFHAYAPPSKVAADNAQPASTAAPTAAQPRLPNLDHADQAENLAAADEADEIPSVQPRALSDVELASDTPNAANDPFPSDSQSNNSFLNDTLVNSARPNGGQQPGQNYAVEPTDGMNSSDDLMDSFELDEQSLAAILDGLDPLEPGADTAGSLAESPGTAKPADPEPADPEPADPEPADPEPADPKPADPEPADTTPATPETADNLASEPPDDLDAVALENCFTSIRRTDSMLDEWSLAVSAKQHNMALAQETYSELANLALSISELPSRDLVQQAVRGQLRSVRKQVEQKLEVRSLIDQGARFWMRSQSQQRAEAGREATDVNAVPKTGRYGLAITAVVDSVTASSDGQWSTVTASATTQSGGTARLPLDLQIPQDMISLLPDGKLGVGQKLFLLGTVDLPVKDAADDSNSASEQSPMIANYLAPL